MANRADWALALKAQTVFGTPITTGLQYTPASSFRPGLTFNQITDDTVQASRLAPADRAGTVAASPSFDVNLRSGAYDTLLESLMFGSFATDILVQGNTRKYLTVEDRQQDVALYNLYQDQLVNTCQFSFGLSAFCRATFGLVGVKAVDSATATTSPVADPGDKPFDTFTGTLLLDGVAVDVNSIDFTVDNRIEPRYSVLKTRYPTRIINNTCTVKGRATMVLGGRTELDNTLAGTAKTLSIATTFGTKGLTFAFGSIKLTSWDAPVAADGERFQSFNFDSDISGGTKLTITRDNT